jgi:hypothetical protein
MGRRRTCSIDFSHLATMVASNSKKRAAPTTRAGPAKKKTHIDSGAIKPASAPKKRAKPVVQHESESESEDEDEQAGSDGDNDDAAGGRSGDVADMDVDEKSVKDPNGTWSLT